MTDTVRTAIAALGPRLFVSGAPIATSGSTVTVPSGNSINGGITTALGNSAVRYIDVERNATYDEEVVAPARTGVDALRHIAVRATGWTKDDEYQINPVTAASEQVPFIRVPDGASGIRCAPGARNMSFSGFKIQPLTSSPHSQPLISLADAGAGIYTRLTQIPANVWMRHIYAGGIGTHLGTNNCKVGFGGIATNSGAFGCWIDNVNFNGLTYLPQAQAMSAVNGLGRLRVYRTFLMASSEIAGAGGADSVEPLANLKQCVMDVEYDRCYFYRSLAQKPYQAAENGFELKLGRRYRIRRSVFDTCWPTTQHGIAFVLWSNNNSTVDWDQTADVTMEDIWVRNYPQLFGFYQGGTLAAKPFPQRLTAYNVLATGLGTADTQTNASGSTANYTGRIIEMDGELDDICFQRLTAIQPSGTPWLVSTTPNKRLNMLDSVLGNDYYANDGGSILFGSAGTNDTAWAGIDADSSGKIANTLFVGGNPLTGFPNPGGTNAHVSHASDVGFVDATKVMGAATEYSDLASCAITGTYAAKGCDIPRLITALDGVCPDRTMLGTLYGTA